MPSLRRAATSTHPFTLAGIQSVMDRLVSRISQLPEPSEYIEKSDILLKRNGVDIAMYCSGDESKDGSFHFSLHINTRDAFESDDPFDNDAFCGSILANYMQQMGFVSQHYGEYCAGSGVSAFWDEAIGKKMAILHMFNSLTNLVKLHRCECDAITVNDSYCDSCIAHGVLDKESNASAELKSCGHCSEVMLLHRHTRKSTCCGQVCHKRCTEDELHEEMSE